MLHVLINDQSRSNRRGAMVPLVAVVIVILFVAAALSIDIARIHVTRSELRTATDAAARAAVETLGREQNEAAAIEAAMEIARLNLVAGVGLTLEESSIQLGGSTLQPDGTFAFDPDTSFKNSARVVGLRTNESPDGPVGMLFGPLFGMTSFQPIQSATATRLDRDIALVLDVSGSMSENDRFTALSNALEVFLDELDLSPQDETVSLTVYSTTVRKRVELTENLSMIRIAFAEEQPDGYTAIGDGIQTGLDSLTSDPNARPFALKSIIVMTDGNQNRGVDPTEVAQIASDQKVTLHTITFGDGANQELMRQCSTIGNGDHYHALDDEELVDVFQTIARQLRVLLTE